MIVLSLSLVILGMAVGLVFSLFSLIVRLFKGNFLARFSLDIAGCLLAGFGFILCIFSLFDGEFAFFEAVCFSFGIILEQIFVINIFAKFFRWVYNRVIKRKKKYDSSKTGEPS